MRRDTGGVVADARKDGGNRSRLRRVNRRGVHGEERFVRGNAVALTEVEGEQRSGKRRGDLFGIRGDDGRVGGGGEGGGSRQRECRKSGGKRNQLFHGKNPFCTAWREGTPDCGLNMCFHRLIARQSIRSGKSKNLRFLTGGIGAPTCPCYSTDFRASTMSILRTLRTSRR